MDGADGFSALVWTPRLTGRRRAVAMSILGDGVGAVDVRQARLAAMLTRIQVGSRWRIASCLNVDFGLKKLKG